MSFHARPLKAFRLFAAVTLAASTFVACGVQSGAQTFSDVNTVDLPQTQPKWQSIGNCWIYSFAGWAESSVLATSGGEQTLNISESYLTYLHYRAQLLNRSFRGTEVETGGWFESAAAMTLAYGYMLESDFIPEESDLTFSARQKAATKYLNASLTEGVLKTDRSVATVKAELNAAFGVDIDALQANVKSARNLKVKLPGAGGETTLAALIDPASKNSWRPARWIRDSATPADGKSFPYYEGRTTASQSALLKRVKKALNAGQPVVMDWFVDFNALGGIGVFSGATLAAKGPGRQGYHSTVIEDYIVEGIDPATGAKFVVGEGEATPELKKLAEDYGQITAFIVKNSWGGAERLDRVSYVRDGESGYHKLDADYIFSWMKKVDDKGQDEGIDTGASRFILPAGF